MGIFAPVPGPTPLQVRRGGEALLWSLVAATVALCLMVGAAAPERMWLVPAGLVGACGLGWLARRPVIAIYAALALLVTALNKDDGLQANQVIYGLFAYLMLGVWYLHALSGAKRLVRSTVDRIAAFLLVGGLPIGIATGLFLGADPVHLRGEVIAYSMLAFYFPVRVICREERHGPFIVASIILFIGAFIALRNMFSFREIMLAATQDWQVADARAGQGSGFNLSETQLMAAVLMALSLFLFAKKGAGRVLLLAVLGLAVFGLVMTRSRASWVATLLGIGLIFVLVRGSRRVQLVTVVGGAGAATLVGTYLLLGPMITDLILGGTLDRFSTLGGATQTDVSWLNRLAEARSVISKGLLSPVLGWGLGSSYQHFDIINKITYDGPFIHNGYVALWFKHGVWGVVLFLGIWAAVVVRVCRLVRLDRVLPVHRGILLAVAAYLVALTLSTLTSNPFSVRDQILFFALFLALGEGLAQRYAPPRPSVGGARVVRE